MDWPVLATGGFEEFIFLWQAQTAAVLHRLEHRGRHVNCLEASQSNRLLAVAGNLLVKLFDVAGIQQSAQGNKPIRILTGHSANVTSTTFCSFPSASRVRAWPTKPSAALPVGSASSIAVGCSVGPPPNCLLTSSEDGTCAIFDCRAPAKVLTLQRGRPIHGAALHPTDDDAALVADNLGNLLVWDVRKNDVRECLALDPGSALRGLSTSCAAEGLAAVSSHSGLLFLVSASGGVSSPPLASVPPASALPRASDADALRVAGGALSSVKWGEERESVDPATLPRPGACVGLLGDSCTSRIERVPEEKEQQPLAAPAPSEAAVGSGGGRRLSPPAATATAADAWGGTGAAPQQEGDAKLAQGATEMPTSPRSHANQPGRLKLLDRVEAHGGRYVLRTRFSPGGNLLATSSADGSCSIWRFHGGSVARASTLEAHPDAWAWDCVFTQDGAYLLTGGSDCVCKLWEVQSGRAVLEYRGHRQVVSALALFDAPLEASAFPSYPGVREANDPRLIGGGQAALGPPIAS
eukprot:GHVT01083529.1.p1 GENE.GHVT01083529.1~~GHVT01083529.1.p1  ORF type:complete len:523 (+),score=129.58 GHVT01083529.1:184-1752(+)